MLNWSLKMSNFLNTQIVLEAVKQNYCLLESLFNIKSSLDKNLLSNTYNVLKSLNGFFDFSGVVDEEDTKFYNTKVDNAFVETSILSSVEVMYNTVESVCNSLNIEFKREDGYNCIDLLIASNKSLINIYEKLLMDLESDKNIDIDEDDEYMSIQCLLENNDNTVLFNYKALLRIINK